MEDVNNTFKKSIEKNFNKSGIDLLNNYGEGNDVIKMNTSGKDAVKQLRSEEEDSEGETTEATTSASSGSFSIPFMRNNLFQPGTESKLDKVPVVHENEIPGGLADKLTIEDIAKKHKVSVDSLQKQIEIGIDIEMEHTDSLEIAFEIAKDHIFEDPKYYSKLKKMESEPKKVEAKEATTSASTGAYDVPFPSKKRRNPLAIDGEKSIYSSRAVKDPKFPKYGGSAGKYVKVKDKCKTFPYCNQGDINALQFFEHKIVKKAVENISEKYKIDKNYILGVILENLDIYFKSNNMNKNIENMVDSIVEKVLNEEIQKSTTKVSNAIKKEAVKTEIDEMEEFFENVKKKKESRKGKPDFLDLDKDGDKKEPMKKAAKEMREEEVEEGNEFSGARAEAIKKGKDTFEVDGKTYPVKGEEDEIKESIELTEDELISLIERIINEEKVQGVKNQEDSRKESKKFNDDYIKSVAEKMKDYLKGGSKGKYEENPVDFPRGNGEMKDMDKKAFQPSDEAEEFIEIYAYPGMTEIDYDIAPSDERIEMYLKGNSKTGNAEIGDDKKPNGNVVPKKKLGDKLMKKYKEGKYQDNKRRVSYTRQEQPVISKPFDVAGELKSDEVTKKSGKVNEEMERIKQMFNFNYKSQ